MTEKVQTTYRCGYCNKWYLSKYHAARHEDLCSKNPSNHRPCLGCPHLTTEEAIVGYRDSYYGDEIDYPEQQKAMYCNFHKKGVYSPVVEKKWGHGYEYLVIDGEERENEPMPLRCEEHDRLLQEWEDIKYNSYP